MAKESWKIDKFEGGINDYTDPKDLKSNEFVELQDCSVGKIGQIKNMGKPIVNTSLESVNVIEGVDTTGNGSVDLLGGLLPGKGFFKSPNDYSLGGFNSVSSAAGALEHPVVASDGTYSVCEFEVGSCLFVFDQLLSTADFDWLFRIEAKIRGGSTILPTGTAGFDAAGSWNIIENFNQGDMVSYLDDSSFTANGHSFTASNPNKEWWITPQLEETFGVSNETVLGGRQNKAVGFYRYQGIAEYDEVVATIKMPVSTNIAGQQAYEGLDYELMRDSFLTQIAVLINARTSAPNVNATYAGYGTGRLKLESTAVGTLLNGYDVVTTMSIENLGLHGSADAGAIILTSNQSSSVSKASGGWFTISGDSSFSGGTAVAAEQWKIKLEGPPLNNDLVTVQIYMNDGNAPQGPVQEHPFQFYNTHVQLANDIQSACNAISGITATVNTDVASYTYVILTADGTGTANGFNVNLMIDPREGFFNSHSNNEQHILTTLSDKDIYLDGGLQDGEDIFGFPITGFGGTYNHLGSELSGYEGTSRNIYGTFLNIYSSVNNSWTIYNGEGVYHPTSDLGGNKGTFDWVWAAEHEEYPKPNFLNDGNKLIMSDGNFNLPNHNMLFGYIDRSNFFKGVELTAQNQFVWVKHDGFRNLRKWIKWPERKVWSFTEFNFYGGRNPSYCWEGGELLGYGVSPRADVHYIGHFSSVGNLTPDGTKAPMEFRIAVMEDSAMAENGFLDWGGVEADEETPDDAIYTASEIKWYLSAVYDDNSETLPTHKFIFGADDYGHFVGADHQLYQWNQFPQVRVAIRPMSGACIDGASGGIGTNDTNIMNQQCFPDPRVKGVRLYYTDSAEQHEIYWNVMLLDFEKGMQREGEASFTPWEHIAGNTHTNQMHTYRPGPEVLFYKKPKGATYEFFNGFDPKEVEENTVRYKHSVLSGNRVFIGNIEVESEPLSGSPGTKKTYNDRMVMSLAGKLSSFPYPNNVFDLNISDGDEITALASVSSKLLQFKRGILYIVDISSGVPGQFFISETLRHKGIATSNHFCETSEGIFFFNEYGAWLYDGDEMKDIFVNIDEQDKKQQRIDPDTWNSFVTEDTLCEFNPISNEVIILKTSNQSTTKTDGDCYIYHVYADAWTFGKERFHAEHSSGNREITNLSHVGSDLKLGYMAKEYQADATIAKLFLWEFSGQATENFLVVTKTTNLGDPRSFKSILGLVINCIQSTVDSAYALTIEWREGPGHDWAHLDNISNSSEDSTIEGLSHMHMFKPPEVKGIKLLQLKIYGMVQGDFGINDINLIFRKYKSDDLTIFTPEND